MKRYEVIPEFELGRIRIRRITAMDRVTDVMKSIIPLFFMGLPISFIVFALLHLAH